MKKILLSTIYFFACIISLQAQILYGTTSGDGYNYVGTINKFTPSTNDLTVVRSFNYSDRIDGYYPGDLVQANDGKLYGMARGGSSDAGVMFSFDPSSSTYTKLKDFDGTNDGYAGSLMQAGDGKLYGTTSRAIFSYDPYSSTYTKLKDFSDGVYRRRLIQANDGKLYGMTYSGGRYDGGTIFSFDPSSSIYTQLYEFDFQNGYKPLGSLVQDSDGKLYGMTNSGGKRNLGVIFSYDLSSSTYTNLKYFSNGIGVNPTGSLIKARNGKLYGMTPFTYAINDFQHNQIKTKTKNHGIMGVKENVVGYYGVIFSYEPSTATYKKLKEFHRNDGDAPYGDLMQASDGKLYGMTEGGGSNGVGVIFSYDPSTSKFTKLKDYTGANGYYPNSAFIEDSRSGRVPTVNLIKPADSAIYIAGGSVSLVAEASDPDGKISKVEFYHGSTLLHTETDSPYTFKWLNVPTGNYTLTAKATDDSGLITISAPIHIKVVRNTPPLVNITSPSAGAVYAATATIGLSADAIAQGGKIKAVKFYSGTTLIHTEENAPYLWSWKHVGEGNYTITAKATDTDGRIGVSAPVQIFVVSKKALTVKVTSPVDGSVYIRGNNILLSATANEAGGKIASVDFYYSDKLIFTKTQAPYQGSWQQAPVGNYYLTAVATDGTGIKITSAPVHIKVVAATPPTVTITSPVESETDMAPATVTLSADAKSQGGSIKAVEFYNGETLLHTEHYQPYSWNWENVDTGSYTIIARAIDTYGRQAISSSVHFAVIHECSTTSKPTFGFNFNGIIVANINNGSADPGETARITICDSGQYFTSGYFHGSAANLYNISVTLTGGTLLVDGNIAANEVITAAQLSAIAGTHTITLADPGTGGTVVQTITPFTDFNNNGIDDAGDCAGEPIVLTYTVTPCSSACGAASGPIFGFNFNGIDVANINNGSPDPGEAAGVTICGGGQYFTAKYIHSSASNLYNISVTTSGGTLLFDGNSLANKVVTADQLSATEGTHTITFAHPNMGGSVIETITPFTDLNNNGIADASDCTGDPIVLTYTAAPCPNINGAVALSRGAVVSSKTAVTGQTSVQLLPNPAHNVLNINTTGLQKNKQATISVISASGVVMKTISTSSFNQTTHLNVSSLAGGTYIVKIISEDKVMYKQFVKM